jgi:hypothetical protein
MESIRELYRIGYGPSSSHTMAPRKAAEIFKQRCPDAASYQVTLFGSLAATGKGHLTDRALQAAFMPTPVRIIWQPERTLPLHPNGMQFEAIFADGSISEPWQVYSLGGGAIGENVPAHNAVCSTAHVSRCKDLHRPAPALVVHIHFPVLAASVAIDDGAPELLRFNVLRNLAHFPRSRILIEQPHGSPFAHAAPPVLAQYEKFIHQEVGRMWINIAAKSHPRKACPMPVDSDHIDVQIVRPGIKKVVARPIAVAADIVPGHGAEVVTV